MITITLYNKAITCSGHANYANKGNDIYCAGVSAIIMSAMNWFAKEDLEYVIKDGLIMMKIINLNEENEKMLHLLQKQLRTFTQDHFKPYITVKESGKDYYE